MTASSLISGLINQFYMYLIEKGYKHTTASTYKNMIRSLINKNINPLDFREVELKLRCGRKNKKLIENYLTACKHYKEFINKYLKETRPSVKHKVYLTKNEALIVLRVLLKIAEMHNVNVNVKCKSCDRKPTCSRSCLVETTISLAKELLVYLNSQRPVQDIKTSQS